MAELLEGSSDVSPTLRRRRIKADILWALSEREGERDKGAGDGGKNKRHSVFLLCICHGHEDCAKMELVGRYLETCQR